MFQGVRIIMTYRLVFLVALAMLPWSVACSRSESVSGATPPATPSTRTNTMVSMENISTGADPQKRSDIDLSAALERKDNELVIEYTVTNRSRGDIYLLDAQPGLKLESREPYANLDAYYLCKNGPESAIVLRGIMPLPVNPVNRRVMPLGTKVEPNDSVKRKFSVEIPLREVNDMYVPRLKEPDQYTKDSVNNLLLAVQFIRSSVEEFKAVPADFAPNFFRVSSKRTVQDAETLRNEFHIGVTEILTRPDLFSRIR